MLVIDSPNRGMYLHTFLFSFTPVEFPESKIESFSSLVGELELGGQGKAEQKPISTAESKAIY
jgi:hypothetical protein